MGLLFSYARVMPKLAKELGEMYFGSFLYILTIGCGGVIVV
jgi:hypothetical protein